jgi:hypothetical protein
VSGEIARRPDGPGVDPELLGQFVENQTKELEIRAQELDIQKQQDNNNLTWARENLAAQERDRAHERTCNRGRSRERMIFAAILVSFLCGVMIFAMWTGKDSIAMELVKAVGFLTAGAVGGYGYGRSRGSETSSAEFSKQP